MHRRHRRVIEIPPLALAVPATGDAMFKRRFWQGFAIGVVVTLVIQFIIKVWGDVFP